MSSILEQLAVAWHRGQALGMYSACSAHDLVLEAAIDQALIWSDPVKPAHRWGCFCRCCSFCLFSRAGPAAVGAGVSDD